MFPFLPTLAFLDVGGPEILMILLVALLLFGSQRLPELARNLGKSIREFKKATSGLEEELKRAIEAPPPPARPRPPPSPSTQKIADQPGPATAAPDAPTPSAPDDHPPG
jgi:sec-independent protein translocase protein TatA